MMIPTQAEEAVLREKPRRPFGVYVVVFLLILGVVAGLLEILRVQFSLTGIWADTDDFFRRRSGIGMLIARLFKDPAFIAIVNGVLVALWIAIIIGLWLLQRWAWVLLMSLIGIILTYLLVIYFEGTPDYIAMALYGAMAFYLNDYSTQRVFARPRPEADE